MSGLCEIHDLDAAVAEARSIGGMGYLATPYTKLDTGRKWAMDPGLQAAFQSARALYVRLTLAGLSLVSPVLQSHVACLGAPSDERGRGLDPLDGAFWQRIDAPLLAASAYVIVPPLPGRGDSDGIRHEVDTSLAAGRPVLWVRHP